MAVTVEIGLHLATIKNQKWTSDDPGLEALLNSAMVHIPKNYQPKPDLTAAEFMSARFGGEIVAEDDTSAIATGKTY